MNNEGSGHRLRRNIMANKCPHCGNKVGRAAKKCWKCGGDLELSDTYLESTKYARKSGLGLGHAALLMILAGALYFISGLVILLDTGYYPICLGDIAIILVFIGAFVTFVRSNYIFASICCLIPGIFITARAVITLNIILIISMICILFAAHLIYKNKKEFS